MSVICEPDSCVQSKPKFESLIEIEGLKNDHKWEKESHSILEKMPLDRSVKSGIFFLPKSTFLLLWLQSLQPYKSAILCLSVEDQNQRELVQLSKCVFSFLSIAISVSCQFSFPSSCTLKSSSIDGNQSPKCRQASTLRYQNCLQTLSNWNVSH